MKLKRSVLVVLLLCVLAALPDLNALEGGGGVADSRSETGQRLYQISTLQALLAGEYDGKVSAAELLMHGNMGLGTFDRLDGEMIIYDGVVYKARVDGRVYPVADAEVIPFANAAFAGFGNEIKEELGFAGGYDGLKKELDRILPPVNKPGFFVIRCKLKGVTYRSVPAQEKPYRPLVEVVKEQAVFELEEAEGVIVGFRFPDFFAGINAVGYHLHFLSDDRKTGGHLLNALSGEGEVAAGYLDSFEMFLPDTISSAKLDSVDAEKDVHAVESITE